MTTHLARCLAFGATSLLLAGCVQEDGRKVDMARVANDYNVYDTGSMDAERFARQTYPIWNRPGPYKERDLFREERYTKDGKPYVRPEPGHVPVIKYEDGQAVEQTTVITDQTTTTEQSSIYDEPSTDTDAGFTTQSIPVQASVSLYGKLDDDGHWLPAIPVGDVPGQYLRREVSYSTDQRPGTIVVDTRGKHLYFVLGHNRAIRYGVGIGRQGYAWKGEGTIKYKRAWPRWTPSEDYVNDKPQMKMFSASYGGLVGGIKNPLGARALYIYANGKDTLFRVHGTPDWKSIGKQVSSGCIRMFNQDVIDLEKRVKNGAKIVVM